MVWGRMVKGEWRLGNYLGVKKRINSCAPNRALRFDLFPPRVLNTDVTSRFFTLKY